MKTLYFIVQPTLTEESFQVDLPGGIHVLIVGSGMLSKQRGNFLVDLDVGRFLGSRFMNTYKCNKDILLKITLQDS